MTRLVGIRQPLEDYQKQSDTAREAEGTLDSNFGSGSIRARQIRQIDLFLDISSLAD